MNYYDLVCNPVPMQETRMRITSLGEEFTRLARD